MSHYDKCSPTEGKSPLHNVIGTDYTTVFTSFVGTPFTIFYGYETLKTLAFIYFYPNFSVLNETDWFIGICKMLNLLKDQSMVSSNAKSIRVFTQGLCTMFMRRSLK